MAKPARRRTRTRSAPGRTDASPAATRATGGATELAILVGAVLVSIVVRGLSVANGFGESDAARLAVYAAEWHHTGSFSSYTYALRTSPLYTYWIKSLFDIGVAPLQIPAVVNWANVIISSLTFVPLYYLWRNLFGTRPAVIACVFLFFTPVYWLASIYGMPHLPAFGFFVTSLLLYQQAVAGPKEKWGWIVAASAILGAIAVMLKADIVLSYGAYLGVACYTRALNRKNLAAALLIPPGAVAAVLILTRLITSGIPAVGRSAVQWSEQYPFTLDALRDAANRMILLNTVGWVLSLAIVAGIVYALVRRTHGRALIFVALWALPPLLFWGLKMGNSARHMMTPFVALIVIASLALASVVRRTRWLAVAMLCLLTANYFIGNRQWGGTTSPQSQLHEITRVVHLYAGVRHAAARLFVNFPYQKKAYAGSTSLPYVAWECLAMASNVRVDRADPVTTYAYDDRDGKPAYLAVTLATPPCSVTANQGWLLYSMEDSLKTLNTPAMVEKIKEFEREMVKSGLTRAE